MDTSAANEWIHGNVEEGSCQASNKKAHLNPLCMATHFSQAHKTIYKKMITHYQTL